MSRLIAVVMVVLLGALGFRAVRGHDPGWLVAASALLAGAPILLAADAHGAQRRPTRQPFWQPGRPNRPGAVHLA